MAPRLHRFRYSTEAPGLRESVFVYTGVEKVPKNVTKVKIASSVTAIPPYTFRDCRNLRHVYLYEGLVVIGEGAFYCCSVLQHVEIPSTVKVIGNRAFYCCSLREASIPDGIEFVDQAAFWGCNFPNFRLPECSSEIPNRLVEFCSSCYSVEILEHTKVIDEATFAFCCAMRNMAIPPTVEFIGKRAFQECDQLRKIYKDDNILIQALRTRFDRLPMHQVSYYQSYHSTKSTLENLKKAIKESKAENYGRQDCFGMTPLHILALSKKQELGPYKLVVRYYSKDLVTEDKWGDLPIYYACTVNAPTEIVRFLLYIHKKEFPDIDLKWERMIERLCAYRGSAETVQLLLETQSRDFPSQKIHLKQFIEKDFLWSRCYDNPLEVVKLLVSHQLTTFPDEQIKWDSIIGNLLGDCIQVYRYMLHCSTTNRLKSLGFEKWRTDIRKMINNIPAQPMHERAMGKNLVFSILEKYELKEATSLLELAVWKREMGHRRSAKGRKIQREQRLISRVTCGADVVISNVLPFLLQKKKR